MANASCNFSDGLGYFLFNIFIVNDDVALIHQRHDDLLALRKKIRLGFHDTVRQLPVGLRIGRCGQERIQLILEFFSLMATISEMNRPEAAFHIPVDFG